MPAAPIHSGKNATSPGTMVDCQGPGSAQPTSPTSAAARKNPDTRPAPARLHISAPDPRLQRPGSGAPPSPATSTSASAPVRPRSTENGRAAGRGQLCDSAVIFVGGGAYIKQ